MGPESPGIPETKGGIRSDQVSGAFLLLLALFVAWQNRDYPLGSLHDPGPGYMPLALAVFLGAMGLLIMIFGGKSEALSSVRWSGLARAVVVIAACAVAAFALEDLGYRLTMLALLIFFLGVVERRNWIATGAVALGFSWISYFVFATWLRVPLPLGPGGF